MTIHHSLIASADSDKRPNEYGPNPKGIGNYDEIDKIGEHLHHKEDHNKKG